MKKTILFLENGKVFEGVSCGVKSERVARVSFYTGVVGYQEVITNPANAGKIVVMTYPLIGNYGTAKKFSESKGYWIAGLVFKERSRITSNWQAEGHFIDFLKNNKILAMDSVDTRAIMLELRQSGEQWGVISNKDFNIQSLRRKIKQVKAREIDFIKSISTKKIIRTSGKGKAVGIIDIGVTNSLLNQLKLLRCNYSLIPYQTSVEEILKLGLRGIVISDGPEQDRNSFVVTKTVKQLFGKLPIFAIGTGCQILAMALGGKINRMHLGHHGVNYPVVRSGSLKGEITQQNHGCAIDAPSLLGKDIEITWRNLNDKTIEGIQNRKLKAFGCQFYPAAPGIGEVNSVLKEFVMRIKY